MDLQQTELKTKVVLKSLGNTSGVNETLVTMQVFAKYKVSCLLDVSLFPWDTQTCELPFVSAVHYNDFMTLQPSLIPPVMKNFFPNSEWNIVNQR